MFDVNDISCVIGTKFPILAAVSNVVTFKNPNEPTQVHLALTDSSSSMRYCADNQGYLANFSQSQYVTRL